MIGFVLSQQFQAPTQLGIYIYSSGLPSSLQFNFGTQIALPWLSVVHTGGTGAPYDATCAYSSNVGNVNLTGSPDCTARIKVIGNPGHGCSSNPYSQFNVNALSEPAYNSTRNESGSSLLNYCFNNTTDLAILRNFRLFSEQRRFIFRLDAFNVFNTVVINAVNNTMQLSSPSNPTAITNDQYNSDGSLNTARVTAANAGFGAATGAQAMRTIQAQIRLTFRESRYLGTFASQT
jgi:hypothetical protein